MQSTMLLYLTGCPGLPCICTTAQDGYLPAPAPHALMAPQRECSFNTFELAVESMQSPASLFAAPASVEP